MVVHNVVLQNAQSTIHAFDCPVMPNVARRSVVGVAFLRAQLFD